MLRLGETPFWIDPKPDGSGWAIYRVDTRRRRTSLVGSVTSPRHAVQTRKALGLSDEAVLELRALADAMEAGDRLLRQMPGEPLASPPPSAEGGATENQQETDDDEDEA